MKTRTAANKTPLAATPSEPMIRVPVIKVRQPDGSLLFKAGRPEIVEPEVSVAIFHKETGVSKRHIATLCEQGLIQHRRLTPKTGSKILIPRSEIDRFRKLDGDVGMPADSSPRPDMAGSASDALHPGARRGGLILKPSAHPRNSKF